MQWQEEFKQAIRTQKELEDFFELSFPSTPYPLFIPKSFAAKIKASGIHSALGKQFLPHENESDLRGQYDPIGDKVHSKGNQLIHRYSNRVLFTPTTVCPIACRYCFRKNELAHKDELFNQNFEEAKTYLREHPEVNEVIFTGGDPLILSNEKLAHFIQDFSEITSLKYIRFHSRTPIILPSRIDEGLIDVLVSARSLFKRSLLMIHVNHRDEIDEEVEAAITRLTEAGIELYSQTVLLKGVNDQTETLANLFTYLSDLKIRPYYLHHPDQTLGAMHFTMPLEIGRRIVHPLHDLLPGWALPQYVIDIPGGEGKISALNPEQFAYSGSLLNRHGKSILTTELRNPIDF
ncbi:MAG: KamA family radical SAM protein [Bacteriovorax sp.]|nr:KamA family radical SAM protein [Bacteriovorax sp.]